MTYTAVIIWVVFCGGRVPRLVWVCVVADILLSLPRTIQAFHQQFPSLGF